MYEGISGAIVLSLISFTMVFFILALLALLMVVLKRIMKVAPERETVAKKAVIPEKDRMISEKQDEKESIIKEQENAGALVAVISAAVASLMERPVAQIKIMNIKRNVPAGASPWTTSGKQNVMSNRIAISSRKRGGF